MHTTYILSALALALPVYSSADTASTGCYSDLGALKSQGPYTFQSPGYCHNTCSRKGFKVAALSRGDMCYCGNDTPSQSAKVDDDQCDQVCSGYPGTKCGGSNAYTLIQGTEVGDADDSDSDQSSNTAAPTAATAAGGIVVAPSTAPAPSGIVTAASSINSKSVNAAAKTSTSATTAVTSTTSPTHSNDAAGTIRAASPLIGAVVAAVGLLL